MKTTAIPTGHCLACGAKMECATHIGAATPDPGDVTLCLWCGHIMVFGDDLTVHNPTDEEMQRIAGSRDVIALQRLRIAAHKRTRRTS